MKYTLIKMKDDKFDGEHPNNINEGYKKESNFIYPEKPVVGLSFIVGSLTTSMVTEILVENQVMCIFKTLNSTYKLMKN